MSIREDVEIDATRKHDVQTHFTPVALAIHLYFQILMNQL